MGAKVLRNTPRCPGFSEAMALERCIPREEPEEATAGAPEQEKMQAQHGAAVAVASPSC